MQKLIQVFARLLPDFCQLFGVYRGNSLGMDILSYNPGHDGAVCLIRDGRLEFSIEAEKDSGYRYSHITVPDLLDATTNLERVPDVLCMSGWWPLDHHEYRFGSHRNGGYRGVRYEDAIMDSGRLFRGKTDYFSSSHERSHILCAFGMSDVNRRVKRDQVAA